MKESGLTQGGIQLGSKALMCAFRINSSVIALLGLRFCLFSFGSCCCRVPFVILVRACVGKAIFIAREGDSIFAAPIIFVAREGVSIFAALVTFISDVSEVLSLSLTRDLVSPLAFLWIDRKVFFRRERPVLVTFDRTCFGRAIGL